MGVFDKLFSKKNNNVENNLVVEDAKNTGYIGEAEQIANIVTAGLEHENYSGMNEKLATVISSDEVRETYVFEHPAVIAKYFATTICVIMTAVFAYFLFIGIATVILSTEYFNIGVFFLAISVAVLIINIMLIHNFISSIKYKTRYDIYDELLGYRSIEFIEDIATCAKQKESIVIGDLQNAVKQKLIPQGHFSKDNLVFMVSNEVYNKYMEKPTVYDRYFQKKIEERRRVESRTERINKIMEMGNEYIEKIHGFSTLVKDKTISRKIERIENLISMIFHEIDVNPSQAQSLGVFLNYYLPTTEKLLEAYVSLGEKQITGKKLAQVKKEIEESINTIVMAFERVLEKLYEEYELDVVSDIEALELTMRQEGLLI